MSGDWRKKVVGGYLPRAALQKLSRDVRNTHFSLGLDGAHFSTAHQQQFRPVLQTAGTQSPAVPQASQSREVHFELGADRASMKTESEAAERFKAHSGHSPTVLSQDAKNELRAHHFGLGHEQPTYVSRHKEDFVVKGGDLNMTVDSAARRKDVRKTQFLLGLDESVRESEARANYTPKRVEKERDDREFAERRRAQRLTNFQMGHAPQSFQSTAQQDFAGAPGQSGALSSAVQADLKKDHFVLGTSPPEMYSVTKDFFTAKREANPTLRPEKVREMRASHIVFGAQEATFQATYRQYHQGGPVTVPATRDPKTVRSSSLVLGSDRTPWTTVYKTAHQRATAEAVQLSPEAEKAPKTHFVLGSDATVPTSTSHRDYQRSASTQPNALSPEDAKALRTHHFHLGFDPATQFKTSSTDYGASGGPPSVMDAARKKDLQRTHFQYGSAASSFETNNRAAFSHKSVSPQRAASDRKSNVSFGSQREVWGTTYGGTYQWIQPVPDTSYRFQIQR